MSLIPCSRQWGEHPTPDRGGAEGRGGPALLDGANDLLGLTVRGSRHVHVREDAGHPERDVEEREEGEAGEVHLAWLEPVHGPQGADLRVEHPVGVEHALGRPGAPAGEQDRRGVVTVSGLHDRGRRARALEAREGPPAPGESTPDGDEDLDAPERGPEEGPDQVGGGDADEHLRGHALHRGEQALAAHAGVRQDGHRAELEGGVGDGDEVGAGPDEQAHPHALLHALGREAGGDPVGALLQFAVRERAPAAAAGAWRDDGGGVGVATGALREEGGDVDLLRNAAEGGERIGGALGRARGTRIVAHPSPVSV